MAIQSTSLPDSAARPARRASCATISWARLIHTPNWAGRRSTHPRGAAAWGSPRSPGTTTRLPRYTRSPSGVRIGIPTDRIWLRTPESRCTRACASAASSAACDWARARTLGRSSAQHPGAVGGAGGGRVERGYHVASGGPPLELHHGVVGDLLGRDELHLAERRDRLELVGGEEAVLPHVDEHALERLAELAPRSRVGGERLSQRHRRRAIHQRNRLPLATDRSEADLAPGDGGRGLDLDRRGRAGRAAQQKQEQRLRARHR